MEFAVIAPVLFLVMLAFFEFGRSYMVMELLGEAARLAGRAASIEGTSSAQIKQAATDFLTGVGVSGASVGVSVNDQAIDSVEVRTMPAYTELTVTVTVPAGSVGWLPGALFVGSSLSGQYSCRRE